ncbi:MAG: hypothetical protein H6584_02420 [Flavobacteriales bacterium]|nr:hypothetical protein [Flavobacteriales bacterium]
MYIKSIAVVSISAILFSCNENNEVLDKEMVQEEKTIELESTYSLGDKTPNVYHDYFVDTEHSAGFSSLKTPLRPASVVERIDAEGQQRLSINNRSVEQLSSAKRVAQEDVNTIYGKTITFKLKSNNALARNASEEKEVSMYVPELLEIKNPAVASEEDLFPACYSQDFVLEWNADPKNEEGLVVIAEYFGENLVSENSTDVHITNTDIIPVDNGKAVLNNSLFDGIPDSSVVHIILLRGNVKLEEYQGETFKYYAESHVRLPIVLIKDLDAVSSN